jgi:hypothetical protein
MIVPRRNIRPTLSYLLEMFQASYGGGETP